MAGSWFASLLPKHRRHSATLLTSDEVTVAYRHDRHGHTRVVILAHGFFNNKDTYLFRKIAVMFGSIADVISFDFRGHGQSSGLFSWTALEGQDLRCVVAYAKRQGYRHIGVVGFSLGAAVALVEASQNRDIHSVISVSAPGDFTKIDCHFWEPQMWEDLKLNLGRKGRGKGIRPGNPLLPKIAPLAVVARIAPVPALFVHGAKDWLIRPYHSEQLWAQAGQPKQLVIVPEAGHAEKMFDEQPDEFRDICCGWLTRTW